VLTWLLAANGGSRCYGIGSDVELNSSLATVDAVILAGGVGDKVAQSEKLVSKVVATVCGKPIIMRVIKALLNATLVRNILIVTPHELHHLVRQDAQCERLTLIADTGSLWGNIKSALSQLHHPTEHILFVAGDMPFIRGDLIDLFVREGLSSGADIVYPIVPMVAFEEAFGKCRRTIGRLRDGAYTGGNCMLVRWQVLDRVERMAQEAIAARKSLWRLAKMLGLKILLKLPFGLLTVDELRMKAEQLLQCSVFVFVTDAAELAFDVDEPEQLEHARRICSSEQS